MKEIIEKPVDKELVLEISEQDYQDGLKRGWTDDDMLKPGRHIFRRVSPERAARHRRAQSDRDNDKKI